MMFLFRHFSRNNNSIRDTIEQWSTIITQNPIVNKAWNILLGFLTCEAWKERNHRVFQLQALPLEELWNKVLTSVWEMILAQP